jgi:hypothetical protein
VKNLNAVFSGLKVRRRYEVWFLRMGLADGSGAWWIRYLLMNPGRGGCPGNAPGMPVQIWATWFPCRDKPRSFIQGFAMDQLELSPPDGNSFHFGIGENRIDGDSCSGRLEVDGHCIAWNLRYRSTAHVTLSDKGWIGFSRTPHSDAVFSGEIHLDGRQFRGEPLGWGLQGHNCGYRHRKQWTWTHACFPQSDGSVSTFEALTYEMPFGLRFRKALLWHRGQWYVFRRFREALRDPETLRWTCTCSDSHRNQVELHADGTGESLHRLPYLKTDCSGTFDVANNSLAEARLMVCVDGTVEHLLTKNGAVLEMAG